MIHYAWAYLNKAKLALWAWDLDYAQFCNDKALEYFNNLNVERIEKGEKDFPVFSIAEKNYKVMDINKKEPFNNYYEDKKERETREKNKRDIKVLDDVDAGINACFFIDNSIRIKRSKINIMHQEELNNLGEQDLVLVAVISKKHEIIIRGYSVENNIDYYYRLQKNVFKYSNSYEKNDLIIKHYQDSDLQRLLFSIHTNDFIVRVISIKNPFFLIKATIEVGFVEKIVLEKVSQKTINLLQSLLLNN